MPLVMVENYEEWSTRHGKEPVALTKNYANSGQRTRTGWLLWADGAMMFNGDFETRREPPTNETELLKLRRQYVFEKLERASTDFNDLKQQSINQAGYSQKYVNLPTPPAEAVDELRRLKGVVERLRKDLERLDKLLEQTPEAELKRCHEELRMQSLRQTADFVDAVKSIEL
jgi:hypothetical protein